MTKACDAIILTAKCGSSAPGGKCGERAFKMAYVFKMCYTIPANSIKCSCGAAAWLRVDVNGRLVD